MRRYFGSLLALYGAGVTLLDSPGSFFEVMALSPQSAGTPGSSPGGSSPFSKIAVRNIWLLKDKQAVVEDYEQQGEPSYVVFCANYNLVVRKFFGIPAILSLI